MSSVEACIEGATEEFEKSGRQRDAIKAIGITNQRETTLVWDKLTGEPLYNAIAWPDTRTASLVRELKSLKGANSLQDICGLPLSTYPSSVKLLWLLRNVKAVKRAYDEGRLAFGTVDTWMLYHLNGRERNIFVTDATNASRTMFVDLRDLAYSAQVLDFFGLDRNKIALPEIVPSSDASAFGSLEKGILKGTRITGCLGDQSAALVGQCGFEPGMAKNTYGTGCFLLYNVGEKPVMSSHGLLATVAYHFGGSRKPVYALEGSIAVAGSGVKFLVNNLGMAEASHNISELAATVSDNGGCVFVTAFSGLFAPYWIDDAQGTIFGITQHTEKGHIARATLEATCFQTKAILDAMEKDCGHKLSELAVDGGMTNSDLCMQVGRHAIFELRPKTRLLTNPCVQTQADILGILVDRPSMRETTSLGAAIAAGFAVDVWKEFDELKAVNREGRRAFRPQKSEKESTAMFKLWSKAVAMCKGWVDAEVDEIAELKGDGGDGAKTKH